MTGSASEGTGAQRTVFYNNTKNNGEGSWEGWHSDRSRGEGGRISREVQNLAIFRIDFCIDFGVDLGSHFGPKITYFSMIFCINFQASIFM